MKIYFQICVKQLQGLIRYHLQILHEILQSHSNHIKTHMDNVHKLYTNKKMTYKKNRIFSAVQIVLPMTGFYREWSTKIAKTWNDIIPLPNGKCVLKSIMFSVPQFSVNNSPIPPFNSMR